jgi:YgiT-type zinc finger domain-containing protein
MYDYGDCHTCGERMREKRVKQDFWVKGRLVVVEDVPAGVCPQCGERVVKADVGREMMALVLRSKTRPRARTISVPVIRFKRATA